jgi:hypothetical protein
MGKVVDLEEELDTVKNARQELVLQVPHHTNSSSSSSSSSRSRFPAHALAFYICLLSR